MYLVQRAEQWLEREVEGAEEWVVEGAAHGLADATCFELYGFPESAPPLLDSPEARQHVRSSREQIYLGPIINVGIR